MAIAKVSTKGRVTIPIKLRDELCISAGQKLECVVENGKIKFIIAKSIMPSQTH